MFSTKINVFAKLNLVQLYLKKQASELENVLLFPNSNIRKYFKEGVLF